MGDGMLLFGQFLSLSAKIIGFLILSFVYFKYRRRPAMYWAIAFLGAAMFVVSTMWNALYLLTLSEAVWGSALFYGVLVLLREENLSVRYVELVALVPLVAAVYGIALDMLGVSGRWFLVLGLPYAVSAFFVVISGLMLLMAGRGRNPSMEYLGISLLVFGLHEMDFPVLRSVSWFAPIGFTLGTLFTLVSTYFMLRFVFAPEFINFETPELPAGLHAVLGVKLVSRREYEGIKRDLANFPVLAFVRDRDVPPAWKAFFVSNVGEDGALPPTNLARMSDVVMRYLTEAHEKGTHGIVLIDCPEYLKMYSGFDSLVRFLSTLKDLTVLYEGTLIIVLNMDSWEERELRLLRRLLE